MHNEQAVKDMLVIAKESEDNGDTESAIEEYGKILKSDPLNEFAYNRLMILYRKMKSVKKELTTINTAIRTYEQFYKSRSSKSKKIIDISSKLNKAVGLLDKKGQSIYEPEPIAGWRKRKAMLEKRKK
jgi:DNA-binding SARP family transcriptional activator